MTHSWAASAMRARSASSPSTVRKAARLATVRPVTFMVFDLLRLFGQDVTGQPWTARCALLEKLDLDSRHWQVPPVFDDGAQLLAATADQGLKGIVSCLLYTSRCV